MMNLAGVFLPPLFYACMELLGLSNKKFRSVFLGSAALVQGFFAYEVFRNASDLSPLKFTFPFGLGEDLFSFSSDFAGSLFLLLVSLLWIVAALYTLEYAEKENLPRKNQFFGFFSLSIFATNGIALADNLFTFFLFYELLTLVTYPLVTHKRTKEAMNSGVRYLIFTLSGGAFLLLGILLLQALGGATSFQAGGILLRNWELDQTHYIMIYLCCLLGVGVKAAIMPIHSWLPAAMVAPTPVSALLHAVAVVNAGAFGVIRIHGYIFGSEFLFRTEIFLFVAIIASATIIFGSLRAFSEDHLKKRLAYSTISHLSYIVLGASLLHPLAWAGAFFHFVGHALMKITLFFGAGGIHIQSHEVAISKFRGLAYSSPKIFFFFGMAAMGLTGIPLMFGFTSKWHLSLGALSIHQGWVVAILLLSGVLNMGYFLPILIKAYQRNSQSVPTKTAEPFRLWAPMAFCASLAFLLGVFPDMGLEIFSRILEVSRSLAFDPSLGAMSR